MKRWERIVLLTVAGWALVEIGLRIGLGVSLWVALHPPPFRVHQLDVWRETPLAIRCPRCLGTNVDPIPEPGLFRPLCGLCKGGPIEPQMLGRPVVVVPVDDPSDYSDDPRGHPNVTPCPRCLGTGKDPEPNQFESRCLICGGRGS